MCLQSEYFTGIFLLLCLIFYEPLQSGIVAYATPFDSSEDLRNIFSLSNGSDSHSKDNSHTGNYAEGGLITGNFSQLTSTEMNKSMTKNMYYNFHKLTQNSNFSHKQNAFNFNISSENKTEHLIELSSTKTLLPTKLIDSNSNLFLGVPEVNHINGTSSIKPRKGVHYNKIVPRKGVEDNSLDAKYIDLMHDSISSKKNSKHKPSITKVPCDVEVVTELLSQSQQKVFIPIAVSLILLPLAGILIFFLWKKTREYLNQRYYKRMDFLIDGIYND